MDDTATDSHDDVLVAILIDDTEELVLDITDDQDVVVDLVSEDSVVVTSFQERLQEKFRNQNRTKKQWLFILGCSVAAILTLVVLVLESPFYNVDKVAIKNSSTAPLTEKESQDIQALGKKLKGQPMYRVDYDAMVKKISEFPTIASVSVSKEWPSTLDVAITRRMPAAFIETDKGIVLVDERGYAYDKVATAPAGLPSIDGLDEITFTKKISNDTYLNVVKDAPVEIKSQIAHIKQEKSSYIVELTDGIDVKLGSNKHLKEKLAIAWSIINAKKRSELGYIDVSVPSLPVSGSPQLQL